MEVTAETVKAIAGDCGFELAGIAAARPLPEAEFYAEWLRRGMAGEMGYLADHRGGKRGDPRSLLPEAESILCVGKLYNTALPYSTEWTESETAWISRYAWGADYHDTIRAGLEEVVRRIEGVAGGPFPHKICVDTAPLLERAYARRAGLGWIGRNTCLIHEPLGSWFFLGEVLLGLHLAPDSPPPGRCGSCTRCIDACPTDAIVPTAFAGGPGWTVDSRLCISYFTIELRGPSPEPERPGIGRHIFGCDICQDVCPWNRKAPATLAPEYQPISFAPPLERLAGLTPEEFRAMFRRSPVWRSKYGGFLRNVAIAMGNDGSPRFRAPLEKMAGSEDAVAAEAARWALDRLRAGGGP